MKNIINIAKHNLKSVLKGWFCLILVLPIAVNIIMPILFGPVDAPGGTKPTLGVYTKDSGAIYEKLLPKEKFKSIELINSKEELKDRVEKEEISVGVIIDSDNIYKDLKNNKSEVIEILGYDDSMNKEHVLSIINNGINQILSFGDSEGEVLKSFDLYNDLKYSFDYEEDNLAEIIRYTMMFGMFSMLFLFIAAKSLSPLLKERESKIDKRILVSKISKVEYQLGHILGCFLLLLMQSLTMVISMYVLNNNFNISIIWMLVLCVVLSLVGIVVGLLVMSISNNSTMYYTLVSITTTPMALFSGGFIPTEFMNDTLRNISLISPLTWVCSAFKKILLNESYTKIGIDLLAAVSISVVIMMLFLVIENRKKNTSEYL
ncbi:ABC transporter permease [Romboutsia weinsteinii]|uniref:ABC transporter permease n=1 Tax=Romboutsia weinsteinii TaxID=2020949 RepID=A0A371J8X5_9FIRM|nr:ABC transporter permease [Romboutsia weinsteinii]RDY29126.1 ABC transporter permease [Romboutsia weinsteinii]